MSNESEGKKKPRVRRVGRRRVTTEPAVGQYDEPAPESQNPDADANDDRLKADKPPHY